MPKCKLQTKYLPATFAWVLLLSATSLFYYYPCTHYYKHGYKWLPYVLGVLTFFVVSNFTLATFMDPGVIPKGSADEDREDDFKSPLYKSIEVNGITVRLKWCVTCKFYRPPRCSHCSVCNNCIEIFDHHCPWVNNCIGRRNYRYFFFFLISLSAHMISIFTVCLCYVMQNRKNVGETPGIVSLCIMGLIIILFIPIIGLTGFHMILVSRGRTTNEQVTGKFKGGYNPFSRGCCKNCWYTLCGPQYPSLLKVKAAKMNRRHRGGSRRNNGSANLATITNQRNQVKTYMDNSNGIRNPNSNSYNKMSPGRDGSDTDMEPTASQSQDCEPTPPLQRHGSKNNFYVPSHSHLDGSMQDMHSSRVYITRPSPHCRPSRGMEICSSRSHTPDNERIYNGGNGMMPAPSPTMQQRLKAIGGVATPLTLSSPLRRSNPGTPTQPRRPDFIGVVDGRPLPPSYYAYQTTGRSSTCPEGSPQRKFLSEGELLRGDNNADIPPPYPRPTNTVENIRELAGSPQRGVYMWKEASPNSFYQHRNPPTPSTYDNYHRSNPTSPTQRTTYCPALRGGIPVYPPPQSPQIKRKIFPPQPPQPQRPVSFMRTFKPTESIELAPTKEDLRKNIMTTPTNAFDVNYEINV